jgi:predicted nucleotidyltransferase
MMPLAMCNHELLSKIKSCLSEALGDRLGGLVLYGSEARGEAGPESDIDLLVLLKGRVNLARDIEAIVGAIYPIQLRMDRIIEALPASHDRFSAGTCRFYRRVQAEGIYL